MLDKVAVIGTGVQARFQLRAWSVTSGPDKQELDVGVQGAAIAMLAIQKANKMGLGDRSKTS